MAEGSYIQPGPWPGEPTSIKVSQRTVKINSPHGAEITVVVHGQDGVHVVFSSDVHAEVSMSMSLGELSEFITLCQACLYEVREENDSCLEDVS